MFVKMVSKNYSPKDIKNVRTISIIMWGLLGDVLIRTPVLEALSKIFPDAKITVIVDPIGAKVLASHKKVNDIIVIKRDKKNKILYNFNKIKTILNIRKRKFDLIVNLYNGGSSPLLVLLSGAKYKLGFCLKENEKIYNIKYKCEKDRLKQNQSLYNYMISIVEPFSNKNFSLKPTFYISQEEEIKAKNYLNTLKVNLNKTYLLNFGSGDLRKVLENKKYFSLIKYIYDKYDFLPLIISNPNQEFLQENFINDFLKKSYIPYIKLKTLSLEKLAYFIKSTKFIITPDTGIMHLAMVYDNPIYAIFTYTNPIFVDIGLKNFIPVYENFTKNEFYKKQNISEKTLFQKIDKLFNLLSS